MKYRIYPQKSDVLAMFLGRQEKCEARIATIKEPTGVLYMPDTAFNKAKEELAFLQTELSALKDEIALIQSHGPAEIAVEIED